MPPKHTDSKGMLQSPLKGESYASIVGGNGPASRTRGAGGRRPSNEGLESIASEADLAQYDTGNGNGSGTSGSGSSRSMPSMSAASSSTPASASVFDSDPDISRLIGLIVAKVQSAASTASAKPPSVATPKPSAPASSSSSSSGSITIEPTVGRLINGMSSITGLSVIPSHSASGAATIPGGASVTDDDHDSDADDEKDPVVPARPGPNTNDLVWAHIHVAEADRWAPGTVANVQAHFPSFQARATMVKCKDGRNAREVDTLSAIADAAIARRSDVVLELVIRRIFGVEEADKAGGRDWDSATVLDLTKPGALGTDDLRRRMRKDTAQLKANRSKGSSSSRTAAGTGGAWKKKTSGGQGGKGNYGGSGTRSGGGSGNTATKH